jgi:hypothetical protein
VSATIKNGEVMVNGENYGSMSNSTISLEIEGDGAGELMKLNASALKTRYRFAKSTTHQMGKPFLRPIFRALSSMKMVAAKTDDCVVI